MASTTDTIGLLNSIKTLIQSRVIGQQTTSVTSGSDTITVASSSAFRDGDTILIFSNSAEENEAYERQVIVCNDESRLWLNEPINTDIQDATIIKRIGNHYLRDIYIGNPPVVSFPCVQISGNVISESPYALAGTSNATYAVTISIQNDGADYESVYESLWTFEKAIENMLIKTINPCHPSPRCIWNARLVGTKMSGSKSIEITMVYDELLQRFSDDLPILHPHH